MMQQLHISPRGKIPICPINNLSPSWLHKVRVALSLRVQRTRVWFLFTGTHFFLNVYVNGAFFKPSNKNAPSTWRNSTKNRVHHKYVILILVKAIAAAAKSAGFTTQEEVVGFALGFAAAQSGAPSSDELKLMWGSCQNRACFAFTVCF